MVSGGISAAAAMGAIAGRGAVDRVMVTGEVSPDQQSVANALDRIDEPLTAESGDSWRDFEDRVRQIVTDYVGMRRTDKGMRHGLTQLRGLVAKEAALSADTFHSLMRTLEAKSIRQAAEIMAEVALHRTESRSGAAHRRLDYPETDDVEWKKAIVVSRDQKGVLQMDYLIESKRPEQSAGVAQ